MADLLGQRQDVGKKRSKDGKDPAHQSTTTSTSSPTLKAANVKGSKLTLPNELRIGDIPEHQTGDGNLYLCAFKDIHSHRIVGYSIDSRMKSRLAIAALNNAVARRGDVAGVVHADRRSQFRSRKFVCTLGHHNMVGSMGHVGACGDNTAMESFFALLQKNVLDCRSWATHEELRDATVTWIEGT